MTYTALAILFLVVAAGVGLTRPHRVSNVALTAALAVAMVCAQFLLLLRG